MCSWEEVSSGSSCTTILDWTPGKFLLMQILSLYPRLTELDILEIGPSNLCFDNPPGDSDADGSLRTGDREIDSGLGGIFPRVLPEY